MASAQDRARALCPHKEKQERCPAPPMAQHPPPHLMRPHLLFHLAPRRAPPCAHHHHCLPLVLPLLHPPRPLLSPARPRLQSRCWRRFSASHSSLQPQCPRPQLFAPRPLLASFRQRWESAHRHRSHPRLHPHLACPCRPHLRQRLPPQKALCESPCTRQHHQPGSAPRREPARRSYSSRLHFPRVAGTTVRPARGVAPTHSVTHLPFWVSKHRKASART